MNISYAPSGHSFHVKKLRFILYITASLLSHLLLIALLALTHPFSDVRPNIFNVALVAPSETSQPQKQEIIRPKIAIKKPLIKRPQRPVDKRLKPETLYGEGAGLPGHDIKTSDSPKTLKDAERQYAPKEGERPSDASKEGRQSLPSSKKDGSGLAPLSQLFDKETIEEFADKGAPPQKGLTFDTSEFKHRGYMKMLKERIEGIWKYPDEAARRGISGDLYMKFSIKKDGKLGDIELLRTSGYRELDEAAMKAVRNAQPFWPLPDDWDKDVLEIKGHFIYVYGNTIVM